MNGLSYSLNWTINKHMSNVVPAELWNDGNVPIVFLTQDALEHLASPWKYAQISQLLERGRGERVSFSGLATIQYLVQPILQLAPDQVH